MGGLANLELLTPNSNQFTVCSGWSQSVLYSEAPLYATQCTYACRNPPLEENSIIFKEQQLIMLVFMEPRLWRNNPGKTTCWRLLNKGVPPVDESCSSMPKWDYDSIYSVNLHRHPT